ncbi:MAG: endonuclease III [Phycisphaerae bacterium]|nr:endonuclease III [Phycisphaerae bacterium]
MAKRTAKKTPPTTAIGNESIEDRKARAGKILAGLRKSYPDADCALSHANALELLVATILSAQCTDERVNIVTKELFERYKTAADYAAESPAAFEKQIRSTGFFRQKTKSILGACAAIVADHDGNVPETMAELLRLPGVARKTANVVLGTWFKKNEGIVVDTHVGRLAQRMRLTWTSRDSKDAVKIESDLIQLIPRKSWTFFAHAMTWHGRRICAARKPKCQECRVSKWCPSAFAP